jgi:Domain of unknown function (DUF4271)
MLQRISLFLFLLHAGVAGFAQSINPFDLRFRLPESVLSPVGGSTPNRLANPFDVVAHRTPNAPVMEAPGAVTIRPFSLLPKGNTMPKSGLFWVLCSTLGLLGISVASSRSSIIKAWGGFINDNALLVAQRDSTGLVGNTPYYLLYLNFIVNAGLFIFMAARAFNPADFNNFAFLVSCILIVAAFFIAKHAIVRTVGYLYNAEKETDRYQFLIMVFNCILGLFLLPFNFLLAYPPAGSEEFLLFWMMGLIGTFYIYRAMRATQIGNKFLSQYTFHFLLYLCAVEIAPFLLMLKLAQKEL